MRNSIAKRINTLVPGDLNLNSVPDTQASNPLKRTKKWKKRYWNSLSTIKRSQLTKE